MRALAAGLVGLSLQFVSFYDKSIKVLPYSRTCADVKRMRSTVAVRAGHVRGTIGLYICDGSNR